MPVQELELLSPSVGQAIGALPPLAPASQGLFQVLGSTATIVDAVAKGAGQGSAALPAGFPGRRLLQVILQLLCFMLLRPICWHACISITCHQVLYAAQMVSLLLAVPVNCSTAVAQILTMVLMRAG